MTSDDLLNVKRKTAEVEQRGVRTRSYQEIHVTRLDRIPASYRTEHTHVTQAALGRGRENLPPSRPKRARDRATVPAAVDRAQRVLSPVSHATRVLALFTEPEVGPFRDTSYQASRPAATRVAHSRIRLARQASSPSSPSRWHARPARQLLYVTGRPSWLADDQGQQLGAQASSGVVTLAGYPRPPLTSSLVRRHPAHDRARQVPPGQRPFAALGQDGAALAHRSRRRRAGAYLRRHRGRQRGSRGRAVA